MRGALATRRSGHLGQTRCPWTPTVVGAVFDLLQAGVAPDGGCLESLLRSSRTLDRQGYTARPTWDDILRGLRPPKRVAPEIGVETVRFN